MIPKCPGCNSLGEHYEEDQYECRDATCRVVIFHGYGQTGVGR